MNCDTVRPIPVHVQTFSFVLTNGKKCWVHCTMFQPTLCLSSLNELVGQVLRSQQSEMGLLEKLVRKRRVKFIFSSIMYKSPTTFMKGCTKVKPHKWLWNVKLVRHFGRKKEKKGVKGKVIRLRESWNWLKLSQDKWLAFNVTWWEECERKKRGKDEGIKVEAIRPFGQRKKRSEVP